MLSLLVSTGIGSLLTERIQERFAAALPLRLGILLALVAAYLLGTPPVFDALLGAPLPLRIGLSIALIVPLGLVLGGFFPLGIRLAERANPRLVPWAWATNGCMSVVGIFGTRITAVLLGFSRALLLGLAVYALVALCVWIYGRGRSGDHLASSPALQRRTG